MRIYKIIQSTLALISCSIIMCSCSNYNSQIESELNTAEEIMFNFPDSALNILQKINNPNEFTQENKAKYALLLSQAESRNYILPQNDSLINIAIAYYANSDDNIRKAWTYTYAADVSIELKEKTKALNYIQKAAKIAHKTENKDLLCYIYYFWGRMIQYEKPYYEGLNKIAASERYAQKMNDTSLIISRLKRY